MATKSATFNTSDPAKWFRMYAEFATDPKVQMLSELDQRRYVMLLCLRCGNGDKSIANEEITFQLRIPHDEWEHTKTALMSKKLIDECGQPTAWDKRQFSSDSSADRVRKYRKARTDMGLTSNGYTRHSVTVTERDGHCCVYCGSAEKLCIDHVLPVNRGGDDSIENLVCACKECNSGKAGRTPSEAGYSFINKVAEKTWLKWMASRSVTVTVTPPETETETETEKKKKVVVVFVLPEWIPSENWAGYEEMRKATRKPMTDRARRMAVKDLDKLRSQGHPPADVLDQSVKASWSGLYELKNKPTPKATGRSLIERVTEDRKAMVV